MFLKLTSKGTNEKVRINVGYIRSYVAWVDRSEHRDGYDLTGTFITVEGSLDVMVKETPEEIDRLLQQSYITIKEPYENRTSKISQHSTDSSINGSTQSESRSR